MFLADLAVTYSPKPLDLVPLARRNLTVEFGMGSGLGLLARTTRSAKNINGEVWLIVCLFRPGALPCKEPWLVYYLNRSFSNYADID